MIEQERPRTEAGPSAAVRALHDRVCEFVGGGMCYRLECATLDAILAIEAEGRQQAVREIRDHNDYDKMPVRLRAHIDRVAGLNASESPNNNPGGEDHTLQVLPDDSFYCLKCQQVVPPDHSALDTNERPGPFDLAELTGTIENAPIGHLQTALGGNGELLALWIKRMYGQRLRVAGLNASESPPTETNPLYKTWTDSDEAVMAREDVAIKAEATTPETHEGRMLVAMFPHDADYWRNRVRAIEDEMNLRWEERLSRPNDGLDMERLADALDAVTWSVLARLRAAPPLHDPQEPER